MPLPVRMSVGSELMLLPLFLPCSVKILPEGALLGMSLDLYSSGDEPRDKKCTGLTTPEAGKGVIVTLKSSLLRQ